MEPIGGRRRSVAAVVAAVIAALLLTGCGPALGGAEPTGLRIMVPNSPGGGYDLTARSAVRTMEADGLARGTQVFNVVGDGGAVALARLINERGNPDLMMLLGLGVVGAAQAGGSPVQAAGATALARLVEEPEGVLVPARSPYRTMRELIAAWAAAPRTVVIGGGSSPGGPDHLFGMELARAAGIPPRSVEYVSHAGGGALLTALVGGDVAAGMSGLGEYRDQIASGQLRVLAVSGERRLDGVDAPTLRESGVDLTFTNWRGFSAPPGIPAADRSRLIDLIAAMRSSDRWREVLSRNHWTDAYLAGDDFSRFIAAEQVRVADTLSQLGLK